MRHTINRKKVVFLDTETSGLNPAIHTILEVAVVDVTGKVIYHAKKRPLEGEAVDPEASAVNGYSPETWIQDGDYEVSSEEMAEDLEELLRDKVLVGCNPGFDTSFLRELFYGEIGHIDMPWYYKTVCVSVMGYGLFGELLSLSKLREKLGVKRENNHTAVADALTTRDVYIALQDQRIGPQ